MECVLPVFSFTRHSTICINQRFYVNKKIIYTTKGRDRFHWAATPLKPYKFGNICYMTYRYSVLYFLNLSLKFVFSNRKRQFLWRYPNPEIVIVPCFNAFAHAQSTYFPIEDRRHCTFVMHQFVKFNDICFSYSGAKLLKIAQKWNGHWTCRNDPLLFCVNTGKQRSDRPEPSRPVLCVLYCINLQANPTDVTHIYNKIKRTTIWFCGGRGV